MTNGHRLYSLIAVDQIMADVAVALALFMHICALLKAWVRTTECVRSSCYNINSRIPEQVRHLRRLVEYDDLTHLRNLCMDRNAFGRLCYLLEHSGGISDTKFVTVSEQVAMFLSVIAHHKKNWVVKHDFIRSGRTISKHFDAVLEAVILLHKTFLAHPIPIGDDCTDNVRVSEMDKGRYRTRKGHVAVNVLGCNLNMQFIYVLSGWEGSGADIRVLRDAINRRNGLRVPTDNYYLCDNGYSNAEGFLTPYRGVRYHLREWERGPGGPQNREEYFNLKHSSARNVIERAFGLLKVRWAILRSPSYYLIKIQNNIILACCLLHNFIQAEMSNDSLELEIPEQPDCAMDPGIEYISSIETSNSWS
ncbi:UNVERIFIED_CONTAM: hypothetical protein Sradi_4406200 [Sesamum radiatum]|uniref:DDE Tnp4 domain-containing protein n=1 Tax=Sesamum radiatum TaxID=300843 RepID=A0AAW2NQD9_SESRA